MSHTQQRQSVAENRQRLDDILAGRGPKKGRTLIDTTGDRSRTVPFKSDEQRFAQYGARRIESVARVMALLQIARESEHLDRRVKTVTVSSAGAVWQAFKGTRTDNACHTCPTHLQIDGLLPTLVTRNRGLQRHIIVELADCILMPRSINEVDIVVDEAFGREAFVEAASRVLNERGMPWQQALDRFREEARELMGPIYEVLFDPRGGRFVPDDLADRRRLDAVGGYYEGIFVTRLNEGEVSRLAQQVQQEMGGGAAPARADPTL